MMKNDNLEYIKCPHCGWHGAVKDKKTGLITCQYCMYRKKGGNYMPYVIRNCPCFVEGIAIKGNEQKTQTCNNHKVRELTLCQDCTDCKLKQIVELCKENLNSLETYVDVRSLECVTLQNILKLLDVQEVE